MKTSIYKLLLAAFLFVGCSKDNTNSDNQPANNPVNNMLERNLTVSMAKDDNTDITSKFNGLTFHFSSGQLTGVASASNDLLSVNGTWSTTMAYNTISFTFPTDAFPDLSFMNKQWLIAGSTPGNVSLTAANGENDALNFTDTQ